MASISWFWQAGNCSSNWSYERLDCIDHDLLIVKLNAYGFDNLSLIFIYSYISERKKRTETNSSFGFWAEVLFGVPQDSILGPVTFNNYICDFFFEVRGLQYPSFGDGISSYNSKLKKTWKSYTEYVELVIRKLFKSHC